MDCVACSPDRSCVWRSTCRFVGFGCCCLGFFCGVYFCVLVVLLLAGFGLCLSACLCLRIWFFRFVCGIVTGFFGRGCWLRETLQLGLR